MFEKIKNAFVKPIDYKEMGDISGSNTEPFINVPFKNIYKGLLAKGIGDKKRAMDYAKRHAILIGIGNAIISDIFSKASFRAIEVKTGKGRNPKDGAAKREAKAQKFHNEVNFKQLLKSAGFDWLFTGEGFIWHGSVKSDLVKEIMFKLNVTKDDLVDVEGAHVVKHVASTTMSPKYDEKNILGFEQKVVNAKEPIIWKTDNIIHAKYMSLDGRPEGFTPMFAAKPMIETLGLIIDYAGNFFEGGGLPENIFMFPSDQANSDNFKKNKAEIKRFYNTKRRGNMLIAGEMTREQINDWNKDMEFRKLFILYVGSIAFAFGMPLHRIQAILGGDVKSGAGSSDLSDSGYWHAIYEAQDYWENLLNVNFWNPEFGVDMEFKRSYLQDTFRETQAMQLSLQNVETLERADLILPGHKRQVYSTLLSVIPNEAINPNPSPKIDNPLAAQSTGKLPNSEILRGQATKRLSDQKKNEAGKTSAEKKGM